jgi:hypothetical protein
MTIPRQDVTVLVLAAGSQVYGPAMGQAVQEPAFLNVGTKLAIERIVSFFREKQNVRTLLAVVDANREIFQLRPYDSVSTVSVGKTSSVCDSILSALDSITTDWCLVNPVTAVPTSHLSATGAIYFGKDQIPRENWSSMTLHGRDKPIFHSKATHDLTGLPSYPFTGRIYARTEMIRFAIEELAANERIDLLNLAAALFHHGEVMIRYERWLDAGHAATFADSRVLSISSRFFNRLTYDKSANTIRKRSSESTKLELEGRFFAEAPPTVKRYFPTVINSREVGGSWELEMEYIGYPSLAEVFLYGNIGLNAWRRIIYSLGQAFDSFYGGIPLYTEKTSWLYSSKSLERQQALEAILEREPDHPLHLLNHSSFSVNGITFPSLRDAFSIIVERLTAFEFSRPLHIGHGDLCFNNILVDPLFGTLKLIDPRAALHRQTGICGLMDPLYDLAKLNHSFMGLYDSVVNGLYILRHNEDSTLSFRVYKPKNYEIVLSMFQDMLLLERVDETTCTLITSSLFLSLLPLHREDPDRMVALAILGSALLFTGNLSNYLLNS